jgi:hypothetical protein
MTVSSRDEQPVGRWRPDRLFASHLLAGAVPLGVLAVLSWPLALMGLAYVLLASLYFSVAYRRSLTRCQEVLTWVAPWLVAVALWFWVLLNVEDGASPWSLSLGFALLIATLCYLAWQVLALAVRQMLARSRVGRCAR